MIFVGSEMRQDYNKLALIPSVWLSHLVEQNPETEPRYVPMPKKLIKVFKANTALLYPYEWTGEQIETWLHKDVEKFKREDAESHSD